MKRIYPSAVDWWLVAVLVGAPVGIVIRGAIAMGSSYGQGIVMTLAGVAIGVLIGLFSYPCRYTLTDQMLHVRCGVFRSDVPLTKVIRAERSGTWLSAPAWSLRRVRVVLTDGQCVVSPKNRDEFIADIEARAAKAKSG